ncbi:MAG: acetylxylan esterase [Chloroflexota bacterium]
MAQTDLPIDQLRAYRPDLAVPADLPTFWAGTLAEARSHDLAVTFRRVENHLALVETYDVTFAGFGGQPVKGWLQLPAGRPGPLPAVVQYIGYGGGRGLAHEEVLYALAGYAHLVMDTRGQGSAWQVGDTPDPDPAGAPFHPGFMTRGILDPAAYYYRRVYTDAVRAVDALRTHPAVDPARVAVTGTSQGGGIAIAAGALVPDLVGVAPDVPFLCDFPRGITITDRAPYAEIAGYLRSHRDHGEAVSRTLAYFDGAVLARRATAPALFSVALMDQICPPSTVFAAYNHWGGAERRIEVYPFNDHEGGQAFHDRVKLAWLAERFG